MCLKKAVTPWEAHAAAGSWQDLCKERPMLEQVCWQDLGLWGFCSGAVCLWGCSPWKEGHAGAVSEELEPVRKAYVGQVGRGTPCWSRGREWGFLPLRTKRKQHVMNLQLPFPCAVGWEEVVKMGREVEPGKIWGYFKIQLLLSHYLTLTCLVIS